MFFGVDLVVGRRGGFGWLRKAKEADEGGDEGDLVRLFGDHDPESAGGSINSVLRLVLNPSSQFEEIRGRMEVFLLSELEELRTNVSDSILFTPLVMISTRACKEDIVRIKSSDLRVS